LLILNSNTNIIKNIKPNENQEFLLLKKNLR